jgi:polyisoprenyl-teichoic acid--peptidoglycan teichoic acid transferase
VHVRMSPPREGEDWRVYDIQPGEQTLDGHEALAYARSRTGTSDYVRMQRQRCMVASMAGQSDLPTLLRIFPDLIEAIRANVTTNVPLDMLPDMVMLRDVARMDEVYAVGFTPPTYIAGESSEGHNRPNVSLIQETVRVMIEDPSALPDAPGAPERFEQHCT